MKEPLIADRFPREYADTFDSFSMDALDKRNEYIDKGMFAFVAWEWVNPLAAWIGDRKCLEIMSGAGYLAYALRKKGVDIKATDNYSWAKKRGWEMVTEVEELDAVQSIKKYGTETDILILSWPYMDNTAYKCIKLFNDINPQGLIVYIGESAEGCTADRTFFNHFREIEDDASFNQASDNFYAWWGMHDRLFLGKFKSLKHKYDTA